MTILSKLVDDETVTSGSPDLHAAAPDWAFFVIQGTAPPASTAATVFESDGATARPSTVLLSGGPNTGQVFPPSKLWKRLGPWNAYNVVGVVKSIANVPARI